MLLLLSSHLPPHDNFMLQTIIKGHIKRQAVYETTFGRVLADAEDAVVAAFAAVDQAAPTGLASLRAESDKPEIK